MVETRIGPPQPWETPGVGFLHQQGLLQQPRSSHKGWAPTQAERGSRPRRDERIHLSHSKLDAFDQAGKLALHGAKHIEDPEPIGQQARPRKEHKHFLANDHLKQGGLIDSQKWPEKPISKREDFLHDHFKGMVVATGSQEPIEGRGIKKVISEGKSEGGRAIEGMPLPAHASRDALPTEDSRQVIEALLGHLLPENSPPRRDRLPKEDSSQVNQAMLAVPLTPDGRPRRDFFPEEYSGQVLDSLHGVPLPAEGPRRGQFPQEISKQIGAVVSGWDHHEIRRSPKALHKLPGYINSKQVVDSLLGVPLPPEVMKKDACHNRKSEQVNAALQGGLYTINSPRIERRPLLPCEDSSQVADRLRFAYHPPIHGPMRALMQERVGSRLDGDLRKSNSEPAIGLESKRQSGAKRSSFINARAGQMAPCAGHAQGAVSSQRMSESLQAAATNAMSFGRGYKFGYGGFLWNHPSRLKSAEFAMLQGSHTDPGQISYKICDAERFYTT
eukprot:gnl/MRDRNA2_/MRDRNA2_34677_c0_seq1.p1 gnl/MRDRNA2_/MRDRNA2_34677_c0~~gnl/MRDRNA2_/MRDRNA2_34677_c0_seq1.p1  ORF type:complete len:516 (-),score=80.96 gnl/MRDRNA2_/MRDRNA2_34677_c0_seq1:82-1581(-)